MTIIENLKTYFKRKSEHKETGNAPEGICPNCWGRQEWEGEHYTFMKGENGNPSTATYNTFIQDVARKLDKISIHNSTYTCETCQAKYDNKH